MASEVPNHAWAFRASGAERGSDPALQLVDLNVAGRSRPPLNSRIRPCGPHDRALARPRRVQALTVLAYADKAGATEAHALFGRACSGSPPR